MITISQRACSREPSFAQLMCRTYGMVFTLMHSWVSVRIASTGNTLC